MQIAIDYYILLKGTEFRENLKEDEICPLRGNDFRQTTET